MTHIIGAIVLCFISVQALLQSLKLWAEKGLVVKVISISYAVLSVVSAKMTYYILVEIM